MAIGCALVVSSGDHQCASSYGVLCVRYCCEATTPRSGEAPKAPHSADGVGFADFVGVARRVQAHVRAGGRRPAQVTGEGPSEHQQMTGCAVVCSMLCCKSCRKKWDVRVVGPFDRSDASLTSFILFLIKEHDDRLRSCSAK